MRLRFLALISVSALFLSTSGVAVPVDEPCVTDGVSGDAYLPGINCRTVIVNGYPREYFVYVPAVLNRTADGTPIVLGYHGSGGNGLRLLPKWIEEADAKGFIAAFPSALTYFELKSNGPETLFNTWADDADAAEDVNLAVQPPDYPGDQHWPADDLAFTDAVIDDVVARLDGDPQRVYAAGFSNGGVFAMRLAVDRTDRIAAAASYEGNLRTAGAASSPIPVLYAIGTLIDGAILPLDAEQLLAYPDFTPQVESMTAAFGVRSDVYDAREQRWQTTIDFTEPAGGPASIFRILVLDGVAHEFPMPDNNPHKFSGPKEFWKFFHDSAR